jgi:ABC-type dipeptide/oligopeptide/nickel transport system permease component
VAAMVGLNLPYTIELTIVSTLIGTIAAIPLGVLAATHRGKAPDYATRLFSLAGFAIPDFYLGALLLITFSLNLGWFPINGGGAGFVDRMYHVFLPAIALAFIKAAFVSRLTRSSLLEVLNKDFVRTARAKGASQFATIWRHALGNSLIPITTVVGLYLGILIGNSVLTEIVFSRPGLGKLILTALTQRDYTLLQGMIVIYTLMVVVVNLLTDLTYGFLDPRVQYK